MNHLEEITSNSQVSIERVSNVSKALYPINNLLPFPLTDTQLEDWSKFILEQEPVFDTRYLSVIFNYFITGKYKLDGRITVMDIFCCYEYVLFDLLHDKPELTGKIIDQAYKYRKLLFNKTKGVNDHNWAFMRVMEIEDIYQKIKENEQK
jgi:hypothetical protein